MPLTLLGLLFSVRVWGCGFTHLTKNINGIFGSKEAIEACKRSLGEEMIVSLQVYTDANDKDMRKRGIFTTKDLLYKILEVLTDHVEKDRRNQAAMGQNTRWSA